MADRIVRKLNFGRKLLLATAGLAAITGPITIGIVNATPSRAQSRAASVAPAFEVASVKQDKAGGDRNSMATGPAGINYSNVTLKACLRAAYGLKDYQILGPAWLNSDKYDIVAKAAGSTPDDQLYLMLQKLLADRFKLKIHRESKELPVYALVVVGKNGPKFHEAEGDGPPRRRLVNGSLVFQSSPVSMLAEYLMRIPSIGRPVLDMTGLKGIYDMNVNLVEGDEELKSEAAMKLALERGIFTALQEQLGLKLEPRRSVVDLLIVDQAERVPTEN